MKITSYDKLKEKLDVQLKKIEILADKKADEIEEKNFYKYRNLYDISIYVLQKYDVLLYGGTALNEILPEHLKFYKANELPDIDFFCIQEVYEKLSKDLLNTFQKKGYVLTTIREALHENTYKFMVEGLQLLDITIIPADMFRILEKDKIRTSFKIYTVSVDYLKYTLHTMLSQSLDAHRWPNVFQRLVRIYEVYPLDIRCQFPSDEFYLENIPTELVKKSYEYQKEQGFVGFGWDVITMYLKEDTTVPINIKKLFLSSDQMTPVQYIVTSNAVKKQGMSFVKYLNNKDVQMIEGDIKNSFLEKHVILTYKGEKWIYLFESTSCSSYQVFRSKMIFSIHSVIRYLYMLYFATQDRDIYCIIQMMILLQMNNSLSTKKIFQQFVLDCYGYQKGLITLRKDRFQRLLENTK